MKKYKIIHLTVVIAVVLYLFVTLVLLFALSDFGGNIDFPCFQEIDEDGCLAYDPTDSSNLWWHYNELNVSDVTMEIFIDVYLANFGGGGCEHGITVDDGVYEEHHMQHLLKQDGNNLVIDDNIILNKGDKWIDTRVLSFWNPWRWKKESLSITNHGVIDCVSLDYRRSEGNTSYGPVLVVIGVYRSYYEVNWIVILVLIVLVVLSYVFIYRRGRR